MRVHPNRKNQRARKSHEQKATNLSPQLRALGVATQVELVLRLLPYMKWVRYQDLIPVFWKYVDNHSDNPLRCILYKLHKAGFIDKKYEGKPTPLHPNFKNISGYLYVRRVSKKVPARMRGVDRKLDGTYGIKAAKERAARAKRGPRKPPKTNIRALVLEDVNYIKNNPQKMCLRELAEMHNIQMKKVQLIQAGHIPQHLRGRPVQ